MLLTLVGIQHVVDEIQGVARGPAVGEHEQGPADREGPVQGGLF